MRRSRGHVEHARVTHTAQSNGSESQRPGGIPSGRGIHAGLSEATAMSPVVGEFACGLRA
jgi:hypothetical protein